MRLVCVRRAGGSAADDVDPRGQSAAQGARACEAAPPARPKSSSLMVGLRAGVRQHEQRFNLYTTTASPWRLLEDAMTSAISARNASVAESVCISRWRCPAHITYPWRAGGAGLLRRPNGAKRLFFAGWHYHGGSRASALHVGSWALRESRRAPFLGLASGWCATARGHRRLRPARDCR